MTVTCERRYVTVCDRCGYVERSDFSELTGGWIALGAVPPSVNESHLCPGCRVDLNRFLTNFEAVETMPQGDRYRPGPRNP